MLELENSVLVAWPDRLDRRNRPLTTAGHDGSVVDVDVVRSVGDGWMMAIRSADSGAAGR